MRKIALALITIALLSGCNKLRLYQVDVQQGNIIDQTTMSNLRTGMDKTAVSSLLGTPIVNNMFDSNTWVYAYTKQVNGGKIDKKKLILEFKNNKLVQIIK